MIEKIYADATCIARERQQTIGEKNDFYITLEQLEFILKGFSGAQHIKVNSTTEESNSDKWYESSIENMRSGYQQLQSQLAQRDATITQLRAYAERIDKLDYCGCSYAGPGRGDCAHFVGLPGKSIPGQHDGPDDTVDVYGKPNGWCWSCWKDHKLTQHEAWRKALEEIRDGCWDEDGEPSAIAGLALNPTVSA